MTTQFEYVNGQPCFTDTGSSGVPLEVLYKDGEVAEGSTILAAAAAYLANNRTALDNIIANGGGEFTDGTVLNCTTGATYPPATDDNEDRGDALQTAITAATDGQVVKLAPGATYVLSAELEVAVNIKLIATGAILKRKDGTDTDYVVNLEGQAGGTLWVWGLEVDGNYDNCTVATGRGEGIRISGDGRVVARNCYAHNAPVAASPGGITDDAAVNFFVIGTGHKKLVDCVSDTPSYAGYRVQAYTSEFLGCDSLNSEYRGNKSRFWVMDGSKVKSCIINGGLWWSDQEYEMNSNFDPDTASDPGSDYCDFLVLANITMNYGELHDAQASTDSLIKFDNVRRVIVSNIIETHNKPYQPGCSPGHPTHPAGQTEDGFMWWDTGSGVIESLFTVGSLCQEAHFTNIIADGWLDLAGSSGGPYTRIVSCNNCTWGANAHTRFGIENTNHGAIVTAKNCRFCHVLGTGGTTRYVFENSQSDNGQKIRLEDCEIWTFWTTSGSGGGYVFSTCDEIGLIAYTNLRVIDMNVQSYVDYQAYRYTNQSYTTGLSSYTAPATPIPTYLNTTHVRRLMSTPEIGDPQTAFLYRSPFDLYVVDDSATPGSYSNNGFVPVDQPETGTDADSHEHYGPPDPETDDGDWCNDNIAAPAGSRIVNLKAGYGGDGRPSYLIAHVDATTTTGIVWREGPELRDFY